MNQNIPSVNRPTTYAQAIPQDRVICKRIPKIIVKKTSNNKTVDHVSQEVSSILFQEKTIKTKLVQKKSDDKIIINCVNNL